MFSDLEDLERDFPALASVIRNQHVPVAGRTTYRHATSGRLYAVIKTTDQAATLEALSGHMREISITDLAHSGMWQLVTS